MVSIAYLRSGKKVVAFSVLPIITVPVFHCLAWLIARYLLVGVSQMSVANFYMVFDVVALGVGLLLCGLCANGFKKKIAVIYLGTVTLFNVIFTAILLVNNLQLFLDK